MAISHYFVCGQHDCSLLSSSTYRSNRLAASGLQSSLPTSPNISLRVQFRNPFCKLSQRRSFRSTTAVSAVVSDKVVVRRTPVELTYLEGNSWVWNLGGVGILVDPVLVGNLDFGIPWFYDASKKYLKEFRIEDLPELDCLLITQSLDDHCHVKTLNLLSKMNPNLQVISTPNAETILNPMFSNVRYTKPGENFKLEGKNGSHVTIRATAGPVLGPPWQLPENGYIVTLEESQVSLYYEPHCIYHSPLLEKDQADIVITPVIKQLLPSYTLVSGQEDAVKLAKLLKAKFVVAMKNGDLDNKGLLAQIVTTEGTTESFKQLLSNELPDVQVLEPTPGVPLEVPLPSKVA